MEYGAPGYEARSRLMLRNVALTLVAAMAVAMPVQAYVPGGRTVVRKFAERVSTDKLTVVPLSGSATTEGGTQQSSARLDLNAGGCKASIGSGSAKTTTFVDKAGKVVTEGNPSPALEAFVTLVCPLLAIRNVSAVDADAALTKYMEGHGISTGTVTLTRLDKRAAYVLGAKARDVSKPQLWIDKDNNRPIRVVAKIANQLWDVRMEDPVSIATNRLAPRAVELWQGASKQLSLRWMIAEPKMANPVVEGGESEEAEE